MSAPEPTHMRIHVGPDGDVEFSVALNGSVDPSMVATMVAAVRAGIVAAPSPPDKPNPILPSPPSSLRSPQPPAPPRELRLDISRPTPRHHSPAPTSLTHVHGPDCIVNQPTTHQLPEPSSDPDPDHLRSDRPHSPLVTNPPRKLSVRQIAARLDAGEAASDDHRYSTPVSVDPAEYDPVREFSSSPSLWLTAKADAYIDHYNRPTNSQRLLSTDTASHDRSSRARANLEKPPVLPSYATRSAHPDRPEMPYVAQDLAPPFSARPIRMLSLPAGSKYDTVNDMYFGDDASSQDIADGERRVSTAAPPDAAFDEPNENTPTAAPTEPVPPRRDRVKVGDVYDKGTSAAEINKRRVVDGDPRYPDNEHDRTAMPSSPYVQTIVNVDDADDAWDNVEYVLTESYRDRPKQSDADEAQPPRSAAWRLFSSIGQSLSMRKADADDEIHQSTLAAGGRRYKSEKAFSTGRGHMRRHRVLFGRRSAKNGGLWLEFSSPLGVERMLGEVGKIAKALGYQVWRRPGENKLRCIRRLNHRHEMHMVIFVGSVRLPEGPVSVVRLKRARGDRNKTEAWRYSHFYRELIERLQRFGIEITSEV